MSTNCYLHNDGMIVLLLAVAKLFEGLGKVRINVADTNILRHDSKTISKLNECLTELPQKLLIRNARILLIEHERKHLIFNKS